MSREGGARKPTGPRLSDLLTGRALHNVVYSKVHWHVTANGKVICQHPELKTLGSGRCLNQAYAEMAKKLRGRRGGLI